MAINPNNQGTGYINIRNYLQANPNINLGQKIKNTYGNELESLGKSFQGAQNQFGQDLMKANVDTEANRTNRENILATPEAAINDPNKLQEFSKYLNPAFNAPNTTNLETQAGIGQQMAQDIVNPAYKTNLLQRYYGQTPNSNYSTGQKTLDTVFLNNPQSSQALGEARRGALQQLGQQRSALSGAQDQIRAAKGQTEQFGKDTQSQLANRIGDYVDETRGALTNRLKDWQAKQAQMQTNLTNSLQSGQFTPQLAQQLGLSKGQNLYGLTAAQIYNPQNLTLSNVASDQDRARLGALYKLKGEATPLDTSQAAINENNLYNLDKDYAQKYLANKQEEVNRAAGQQEIDIGKILGPEAYSTNISGTPNVNYYQYENQLRPYFTIPNDPRSVNEAQSYMTNLGNTLNNIRQQWQQELATSNPTEKKRAEMDKFLNMWQAQIGKLGSAIAQKQNEVGQQLYGNTRVNY